LIRHTVVDVWMERAEVIRQWKLRLRDEQGLAKHGVDLCRSQGS
jgi:hypothetical protein